MSNGAPDNEMRKLSTYLPDPIFEELEKWANQENRSLSGLSAYIIEHAIRDRLQNQPKSPPQSPKSEE